MTGTPCPRCSGTERCQKVSAVICADCRVVIEDRSPPVFHAEIAPAGELPCGCIPYEHEHYGPCDEDAV